MSALICPNCQKNAFTWHIDDDISQLTYWGCFKCHYGAYEDESFERECSKCKKKTESKLEDKIKLYWWCSTCNSVEIIQEK